MKHIPWGMVIAVLFIIATVVAMLTYFSERPQIMKQFAAGTQVYEFRWYQVEAHTVDHFDVYVSEVSDEYTDEKIGDAQANCVGEEKPDSTWSCFLSHPLPASSTGTWFARVVAVRNGVESEPSNELFVTTAPLAPIFSSFTLANQ